MVLLGANDEGFGHFPTDLKKLLSKSVQAVIFCFSLMAPLLWTLKLRKMNLNPTPSMGRQDQVTVKLVTFVDLSAFKPDLFNEMRGFLKESSEQPVRHILLKVSMGTSLARVTEVENVCLAMEKDSGILMSQISAIIFNLSFIVLLEI
jgi:hypothetical protein